MSVGTYHLSTGWVLGKPQLSMTMTAPQRIPLNVALPNYQEPQTAGVRGAYRFTAQKQARVVDAGYGRAEDFAGLDARGKLVLMRAAPYNTGTWDIFGCLLGTWGIVWNWQLENAKHAGATGVLIEPITPSLGPNSYCSAMFNETELGETTQVSDMPFATIPIPDADKLLGQLAHGPVTVDVGGYAGASPYVYMPRLYNEGFVPASLHTTLTDTQMVPVDERFHSDKPRVLNIAYGEWSPQRVLHRWHRLRRRPRPS